MRIKKAPVNRPQITIQIFFAQRFRPVTLYRKSEMKPPSGRVTKFRKPKMAATFAAYAELMCGEFCR